jgi:hypothetical protein
MSAEETRQLWIAMMVAPSVEICEALLLGESVPREKLDPVWVARLERRP